MSYIDDNKQAWEEAFDRRRTGWGDDNYVRLLNERLPFFNKDTAEVLDGLDLKDKRVAQFCCNNGREILSLMKLGPAFGVGFDIAENILEQARETARRAEITNCAFVGGNILDMRPEYYDSFDLVLFTIGAITWFQDLEPLFGIVSKCLKRGGKLVINDFHPLVNILPTPDEAAYNPAAVGMITYPYFRDEPFIENNGMDYISPPYESKTFTSFAHTLSGILNTLIRSGIEIQCFDEFDYDIGITDVYDGMRLPMSFILVGEKR